LKTSNLPNFDLDDLFCWENIEFALLTLPNDIWNDFYFDYQQSKAEETLVKSTGDEEIDKIESLLANDSENVADKLEQFFTKYMDK
jgi:hypothetical protein